MVYLSSYYYNLHYNSVFIMQCLYPCVEYYEIWCMPYPVLEVTSAHQGFISNTWLTLLSEFGLKTCY